jgi:hypothetical protein
VREKLELLKSVPVSRVLSRKTTMTVKAKSQISGSAWHRILSRLTFILKFFGLY